MCSVNPAPPLPVLFCGDPFTRKGRANRDADLAADDEEDTAAVTSNGDARKALEARKIPPIVSHWNLAEYLPASVRQVFLVSVWRFCGRYVGGDDTSFG